MHTMIETSLNGPKTNRKNNQDNESNEVYLHHQRPIGKITKTMKAMKYTYITKDKGLMTPRTNWGMGLK